MLPRRDIGPAMVQSKEGSKEDPAYMHLLGLLPLSALCTLVAFLCILAALSFASFSDFQPAVQVRHISLYFC